MNILSLAIQKILWSLKTASKMEKPGYVIGLQNDRINNLEKDCSQFEHDNFLVNVKIFPYSIIYPYDNLNLDFTKKNYSLLYDMYTSF